MNNLNKLYQQFLDGGIDNVPLTTEELHYLQGKLSEIREFIIFYGDRSVAFRLNHDIESIHSIIMNRINY